MPLVKRLAAVSLSLLLTAVFTSCTGATPTPVAPSQSAVASQGVSAIDTRSPDLGDLHRAVDELDLGKDATGQLTPINMKGTWVGGFASATPTTALPCAYVGTMKSITLVVTTQVGNKVNGYVQVKGLKKTAGPSYCRNFANFFTGLGDKGGVITGNRAKIIDNSGGVWQLTLTGITNNKVGGLATGTVATGQGSWNGTVKLSRTKL